MNYNETMKDIHENAVAHGWWDKPRSYKGIVALFHSELSEALEEDRAGKPMVYYPCNAGGLCEKEICGSKTYNPSMPDFCGAQSKKPEGVAVELADCIIRILDYLGSTDADVDNLIKKSDSSGVPEINEFADYISDMHLILASTTVISLNDRIVMLVASIVHIYQWAKQNNVDMDNIVMAKHEYNKTRPYKHGKQY